MSGTRPRTIKEVEQTQAFGSSQPALMKGPLPSIRLERSLLPIDNQSAELGDLCTCPRNRPQLDRIQVRLVPWGHSTRLEMSVNGTTPFMNGQRETLYEECAVDILQARLTGS